MHLSFQYMYKGEVNVTREQLPSFMEAAATLQIKGIIYYQIIIYDHLYLLIN